ncbi:MAG: type IV pilus assembly protein PilN [Oceanospirillaceae bacterium]|jgi:type IV pilus assembly protein PilN
MAKINLRAWREERNERAQKSFVTNLLFTAVFAVLVIFSLGKYFDLQVEREVVRTNYLVSEINQLKTKIKEIENLKKLKEKRLARLKTIQRLQGNRPLIVRYFDELVRVLPEELHYASLQRSGEKLTINGLANRNQNVSELMRNLNKSQWFGEPNLMTVGARESNRSFNLDVQLSRGSKVD